MIESSTDPDDPVATADNPLATEEERPSNKLAGRLREESKPMLFSPLSSHHGLPNPLATGAARHAVALVTERYVKEDFSRWPPAARAFDPAATIQRVVGAALQTGLPASDVASGVTLGAFATLSSDAMGPAEAEDLLRRTAAAVASAVAAHGGDLTSGADGILDAATRIAERMRSDHSSAIAAAGAGIVLMLGQEGRVA